MFKTNSSKKVAVVTGGAGFLGSHLSDRLLSEGFRVIALDNLITGSTDNIAHLAGNQDFTFIRHNVSEFIFIPGKVDCVFHFASPASPIDYLELPIPTLKVGALGTHNALGSAKEKRATFVLASTSECYGDPLVHPQNEDYWGTSIRSVRAECTMKPNGSLKPSPWPSVGFTGSIPRSIPVDDPKVRQPNITRARNLLGWEPKVDFESGLRETIAYFAQKLRSNRLPSLVSALT